MCSWITFSVFHQTCLNKFHLQWKYKHLHFIKLFLTLLYTRKHLQSLILWILSARLSTRFDNEFATNLALSINPLISFSIGTEKVCTFLCLAHEIQIVPRTCFLILLLWSDYHNLTHCEKLQEFHKAH